VLFVFCCRWVLSWYVWVFSVCCGAVGFGVVGVGGLGGVCFFCVLCVVLLVWGGGVLGCVGRLKWGVVGVGYCWMRETAKSAKPLVHHHAREEKRKRNVGPN